MGFKAPEGMKIRVRLLPCPVPRKGRIVTDSLGGPIGAETRLVDASVLTRT
jgi:hypothetical protein